jgi:pimeloyl-ACP methyl ester carboxylesterase
MPLAAVQGRKVYYESHGPEAGPPLVLVMGMGGSCRGWLPLQVPDFAASRRTIIYDHRGVGRSEDPGGAFTTGDLAEDLAGLLEALEIPRADLLGIFMGGMACQELALRHPERVGRLVLAGTWSRPDSKRRLLLEQWRELARGDAPLAVMIRERLLWTLQDETFEQSDLVQSMIEFFERDGAPLTSEVFARQCDACLGHDTADRLREIRQRTLVLCGRQDALTPPRFHRELADEIPDAHLVTFHYGGHLVMAEAAQPFNHAVLDFLGEDTRPRPV